MTVRSEPASTADARRIKKLPWPAALRNNEPLSVIDAYKAGEILSNKVRAGHHPFSGVSVRQVCEILGASSATMYRTIKVYKVIQELGLQKQVADLSPTLLHNIERIPEKQRKKFFQKATKEGWSKREIVRRVADEVAPLEATRRGRPVKNRDEAGPTQTLRALRAMAALEFDKGIQKAELSAKDKAEAKRLVKQVQKELARLQKAIA